MRRPLAALIFAFGFAVSALEGAGASGTDFNAVPPCRVLDTRLPAGPLGGPTLQPGAPRSFALASVCGIPAGAVAVSVNATVTNTAGLGFLVLYAGDASAPGTSNLSYGLGQTRACASIVGLAPDGSMKALVGGGGADFILDVNGYFGVASGPSIVSLDPVPDQTTPTNTTLSLRLSGHSTDALAALTYGLISGPAGASVSPLGVFAFSPTQGQLGARSVTVQVRDGSGQSAQASFQVNVVDHDHAPVMGPLPDDLTRVGASYTKTLTATDPDAGDVLTFSLLSGPAGMTLSGQTLSWTPTSAQLGSWPVQVKVTDRAGLSASGQFKVGIQFLVATDDAYTVTLGQTLTVNAPGVLANDLDPLSGPLTAAKLTNPDKGTLNSFNSDGSFVYQAPAVLPGPPFVPVVKYHVDAMTFVDAPLVADVDGDGKPELILLNPSGGGITVLKGTDGSLLWNTPSLPAPAADCTAAGFTGGGLYHLAVGDIDDSGQLSIVFPTSCGRDNLPTMIVGTNVARYAALNARDGSFKWLSPPLSRELDGAGNPDRLAAGTVPTLARVRPGETPSIVVGLDLSYFFFNGKPECDQLIPGWPANVMCRGVIVLDGKDGAVRQRMAAPTAAEYDGTTYGNGFQAAVVADLDNDGNIEFVFGGAVFNNDGSVRSNNTDNNTGNPVMFWTGLGNFDDSPDIEVLRLEGNGSGSGPNRLAVYKSDGRLLWWLPLTGTAYTGLPVIADVDGSGRPAVVFNVDGNVCAVDYRGNYKWCHDVGAPAGVSNVGLGTRLQVYDLDGDGVPEVIVPVHGEILLFLDGATGNVKKSFDMDAANGPPFSVFGSNGVGGPVVADFDGSGHASIAQLWYDGYTIGPRLDVVKSQNNDWRPVRNIFNQESYQFGNINDDGTMPKFFVNNFATPATNVFGAQPQKLTPVDPRLKAQTSFAYTASDGALTSAPGTVTITILPTNRPPVFVSTPPTRYIAQSAFSYAAQAVDPDPGDTVTYSLKIAQGNGANAFGNCTMAPTTGVLSCGILFSGEQDFVIVATDSFGAAAFQNIKILESAGPAAVPNVVGQLQAAAGLTLTGAGFTTGNITQIDNPAPAGQVIQQIPGAGAQLLLGSSVDLVVSKGPTVPLPPGPPPGLGNIKRIVVTPASTLHVVGDNVPYKATSINNDGTGDDITAFVVWSSSTAAVATVNAAGVAHAVAPGATILTATASGLSGEASLSVAARANGDFTPPTAIITQPASGGTVTGLTQILGTATDAHFLRYELALQASGDTTFTQIGQGTTQVTSGVLGTLDPTLLLNGAYTLRLTVFDANGNTAAADVPFAVDGNQKVGNFTISYDDLTVSLSGVPIQIGRIYDSRDKRSGDFGFGWSLGIKALRVTASGVQGMGWEVVQQGTNYALVPGKDHFVSVALPNGKVEIFDLQISPTSSFLTPFSTLFATYVPRPGNLGHLTSLENVNLLILDPQPGPVTLVDDTNLNTFNPDRLLYTQRDGTQFVVWRTKGVESVKDLNGNQITITPGGISHSSGTSIAFARDGSGRITSITDPNGKARTYAYSLAGDLASATDRAGNTTTYAYDAAHGLVKITDPLGRPVSRAEYDDQGRLVSLTDANGHTVTFTHDPLGRQDQVENALGRITLLEYDERGNLLSRTDPLGNRWTTTFDARDNPVTITDPLGGTRTFTYDATDSILTETDPLGHTRTFTRDAAGRPLTETDPRGNTTTMTYDGQGNVLSSANAAGMVTTFVYDAAGNQTSLTDAAGATTQMQYDGSGRRTQLADTLGATTTFAYDSNGDLLSQGSPAGTVPWGVEYDANRNIVGTTSGALHRTVGYDAVGQLTSVSTAAGKNVSFAFDPAGRFTSISDSDGVPLAHQTYDAVGNVTAAVDSLGNTTSMAYDEANRLTSLTAPNGGTETNSYDAAGHLALKVDPLGRTVTYTYDAAGRLVSERNAVGGITTTQYDAAGNVVSRTDPQGRTTTFGYNALNALAVTHFPDGTTETRTYDSVGRLRQVTDAAGHSTTYAYDASGNLLTVTDALGHVTQHTYLPNGLLASTTDGSGHTTLFSYDSMGRLSKTTYPMGDAESVTYDAAGRVLTRTNGAGETVQYQYDDQGRLSAVVPPAGSTEHCIYTGDALIAAVTDARGTTSIDYDPKTRLVSRVTEPDGRYVRYAYDLKGNRTLMAQGALTATELVTTYLYDGLDRVVQITAPDGGITTQAYDAVGHVITLTRPNLVTTNTTYDGLGRILSITHVNAAAQVLAKETYTLDAAGNKTRVDRQDGSHVDYQYDALNRVVHEWRYDASQVLAFESVYGYDAAGNLTSSGAPSSPSTFVYNANNQLVSGGGSSYLYDTAGRRIGESRSPSGDQLQFSWDARDRLTTFSLTQGATTNSWTYVYDRTGIRQAKGGAGGSDLFLVDRQNDTGVSQIVGESSMGTTRTFVYGGTLLQTTENDVPKFRLFDGIGSTRALTSSGGTITDTFEYSAYGSLLSHAGLSTLPHRFAGEENDLESGLTYLRARYYDPRSGTFLSRDPQAGDPRDPPSLHKYVYAAGNPLSNVDPSGRQFSLPELLKSMYEAIKVEGQRLNNLRKGYEQAKKVGTKTLQIAGGILSVYTLADELGNKNRVLTWFGGGKLGKAGLGALDLIGIPASSTVRGAASLLLAKTAFDMLGGRNVYYSLDIGSDCKPDKDGHEAIAVAFPEAHKDVDGSPIWEISICPVFFAITPFPVTMSKADMATVLVHEFAHLTWSQIKDDAYNCVKSSMLGGKSINNASNFECWVKDATLNGGGMSRFGSEVF